VWWLVSPQNPLKPVKGMAPFAKRLAGAAALAKDRPAHQDQPDRGGVAHEL